MVDEINVEDESKIPVGYRICIFCQTSVNAQRPKQRVYINDIVIVGLINMSVDVSITTLEPWHPNWPLKRQMLNS